MSSLTARLESLETQFAETQSAQARSASDIERLRHESAKIEALDARLVRQRSETAESIAAVEQSTGRALQEVRRRLDAEADRVTRELSPIESRLRDVEAIHDRLKVTDRRHEELVAQVTSLEARLEALAVDRRSMEESIRRHEDRTQSRLGATDREIVDLQGEIGTWQDRINSQDRSVMAAKAVAATMEKSVDELRRDQHEVEESQRLWEARIDSSLEAHRSDADDQWRAHLTRRDQDWARNAEELAAHVERSDAIEQALNAASLRAEQMGDGLARRMDEMAEANRELRRHLVEAVNRFRESSALLSEAVEEGLPEDERSHTVEERRRELRSTERARRDSSEQ